MTRDFVFLRPLGLRLKLGTDSREWKSHRRNHPVAAGAIVNAEVVTLSVDANCKNLRLRKEKHVPIGKRLGRL